MDLVVDERTSLCFCRTDDLFESGQASVHHFTLGVSNVCARWLIVALTWSVVCDRPHTRYLEIHKYQYYPHWRPFEDGTFWRKVGVARQFLCIFRQFSCWCAGAYIIQWTTHCCHSSAIINRCFFHFCPDFCNNYGCDGSFSGPKNCRQQLPTITSSQINRPSLRVLSARTYPRQRNKPWMVPHQSKPQKTSHYLLLIMSPVPLPPVVSVSTCQPLSRTVVAAKFYAEGNSFLASERNTQSILASDICWRCWGHSQSVSIQELE